MQKFKYISPRRKLLCMIFFLFISNKTFGQAGLDLPIIEDFETDSVWVWKPWINITKTISLKTRSSAHSGMFGLNCQSDGYIIRTDKEIGMPGQAISWWVRFQSSTRANCGFGLNSFGKRYFLCVDPSTNTLHFANSPDYTNPLLKVINQKYKLNVWYRVEITFNTQTNVTGKLYASNGITLLNSITLEIPDLLPGGLVFRGLALHVDDIRGGTRELQIIVDTTFTPQLGKPLILNNIVFESNKSNLLEKSFVELDRLVSYLKRNPTYKIIIVGHTDNVGKEDQNRNLSAARAKAVTDYLIKQNINKNLIRYSGFGSSKPIATNATEEGRKTNRRVECTIDYK